MSLPEEDLEALRHRLKRSAEANEKPYRKADLLMPM
jgi:hypothetical protein